MLNQQGQPVVLQPYAAAPQQVQPQAQQVQVPPTQQVPQYAQFSQPAYVPQQVPSNVQVQPQVIQPQAAQPQQMVQQGMDSVFTQGAQQPMTVQTVAPSNTVQASTDARTQAESFVTAAGLNVNQVEQEVKMFGSISDQTRQALVAKHGEGTTNLLVNSINSMQQQATQQSTAAQQHRAAYMEQSGIGVAGQSGQQTFTELTQWLQGNNDQGQPRLTVEQKKSLNNMFASGDKFQAEQAMKFMVDTYRNEHGVAQDADPILGTNQAGTTDTNGYIDAVAYADEYHKIMTTEGPQSPKLAALDERRSRSAAMEQRNIV